MHPDLYLYPQIQGPLWISVTVKLLGLQVMYVSSLHQLTLQSCIVCKGLGLDWFRARV